MGWGRIDDGFYDHPKVIGLSLEAIGMWTKCFSWAHRHQSSSPFPGHLPIGVPKSFGGNRTGRIVKELLAANLWDSEISGDFSIHDYAQYLPKNEASLSAAELSEKRSNAGKRGADARWNRDAAAPEPADNLMAKAMANASEDDGKPMPPNPNPNLLSDTNKLVSLSMCFADFWSVWPRKESRPAALKAWDKAIRRQGSDVIVEAAIRYAQNPNRPDKQFIPHASTWLNGDRWDDELRGPDLRRSPDSGTATAGALALDLAARQRAAHENNDRLAISS